MDMQKLIREIGFDRFAQILEHLGVTKEQVTEDTALLNKVIAIANAMKATGKSVVQLTEADLSAAPQPKQNGKGAIAKTQTSAISQGDLSQSKQQKAKRIAKAGQQEAIDDFTVKKNAYASTFLALEQQADDRIGTLIYSEIGGINKQATASVDFDELVGELEVEEVTPLELQPVQASALLGASIFSI